MNILNLSISKIRELVKKREISCTELVTSLLKSVDEKDKDIKSYLYINEKSLEEAKVVDENINKSNEVRALEGVPIAIKDNICTKGIPTTCASKSLENFIPSYDATVIKKLKDNGAIIFGKTNMDEFAFGSSTENSAFFITKNPNDTLRVPGGSSGGSAAAVNADLCFASLGSDTGGSIRQPSSFCGVVGLKPTYGLVSRYGLIALASSLDQIGPLTKDVKDSAIMMNVLSGQDTKDATSLGFTPPDYTLFMKKDMKGVKVGVPKEYFGDEVASEVKVEVERAINAANILGADIKEISLPHTQHGISTYFIICTAEASSNLAKFDGVGYGLRAKNYQNLLEMYMNSRGEGFGVEVKRRIMMGTYILSSGNYETFYMKAQKVRSLIRKDFDEAFNKVDIIFTPTVPEVPFKIGEKKFDPLNMYLSDMFTANVNLAGLPAISLPVGSVGSLPVGLQIIAPRLREDRLFENASAIENFFRQPV